MSLTRETVAGTRSTGSPPGTDGPRVPDSSRDVSSTTSADAHGSPSTGPVAHDATTVATRADADVAGSDQVGAQGQVGAQDQVVAQDLVVQYGDVVALDRVSLSLPAGSQMAIVGPSGCGKSTLVKAIAGLVPTDAGRIEVAGTTVTDDGVWVAPEHRGVGVVFQDHALFPHLDVRGNVGFALGRDGAAKSRVDEVLELVGLSDFGDRYPHELSGGEQQRTALARALAPRPAVLLLDEPFSNLDRNLRERVRAETVALLRAERITAIFVTHDRDEALTVGARVAVMRNGRVEQVDSPATVYHAPSSRFVASFLDHADFIPGTVSGTDVDTRFGALPVHNPAGLSAVDVMVRAHEVVMRPDGDGDGVVVATEFRGSSIAHTVAFEDGLTLVGMRPHTAGLAVGSHVDVEITCEHPLTAFPR
ncbi:MAG TPA: ABC transporter ATP-binding protein [Nitriliruptoraceae bacterium]|nr:ABC transporter ATP-binding protein [Nitriliruptoraceae bacterium]